MGNILPKNNLCDLHSSVRQKQKSMELKYIFIFLFIFLASMCYSQSPWVKNGGQGYTHISFGVLPAYDQIFEGNLKNLADLEGNISEFSIQSYTDIGLGKKFGAIISLPYNMVKSSLDAPTSSGRVEGSLSGLGNAEVGLKYNFLDRAILVSGQLSVSLPLGSRDLESGLQTAYDATAVTPYISIGKGLGKSYMYGYIGHEFTNNDYNDNLRLGVEYGHRFFSKLWVIAAFNMKEPTSKTDKKLDNRIEETRLFVNNQYYNSLSLKLIYEISEKVGINGSANLISVRANSLPFQSPLSLGGFLKW